MIRYINMTLVLSLGLLSAISGCDNENSDSDGNKFPYVDVNNPPYNGCVECIIRAGRIDKSSNDIYAIVVFINKNNFSVPIEKWNVFINIEGKRNTIESNALFEMMLGEDEVQYIGTTLKRKPFMEPSDFYVLKPGEVFAATINLSRYYDISKSGIYTLKYRTYNGARKPEDGTLIRLFTIESEPITFEVDLEEK